MRRWLLILSIGIGLLFSTTPVGAQSQPPEDVDPTAGIRLFRQRCANCHGPQGLGDGELAASLPNPPAPIGSEAYQAEADPQHMFQVIQNGNIAMGMPGFGAGNNSDPLSESDIWNIIAGLEQLNLLNQPIDEAVVSGQISHFQELPLPPGLMVTLQAFDTEINEALRLESEVDGQGRYRFDLQRIPPDWFFRTAIRYQEVDFTSSLTSIDPLDPTADLPITLFETTTSDSDIRLSRLSFLIEFVDDRVQIAEVYAFDNRGVAVYTGSSGDPAEGTVFLPFQEIDTNPILLRSAGGGATLFPVETVEDSSQGLLAAVPIGPGPGALNLILRYDLPFSRLNSGSQPLMRAVNYPIDFIEMVLPDSGVTVPPESGWELAGPINVGGLDDGLSRSRYVFSPDALIDGRSIPLALNGWPTLVAGADGSLRPNRNEAAEIWIGRLSLVVVAAVCAGAVYWWRRAEPAAPEREDLLVRLVALDEAHEQGEIPQGAYHQRRAQLLEALREVWEE